jgi:hypothetical protein
LAKYNNAGVSKDDFRIAYLQRKGPSPSNLIITTVGPNDIINRFRFDSKKSHDQFL